MDPKDQVTPPDMATAGMMQPPPPLTNPFAGISAIPSQPVQLPQVPQAPMPMANPFAAAVTGGVNPTAPNPLLGYQNQIQDNLRQEQWQKQQMQLRLMDMETKKQEAGLRISEEMLKHPDPMVKKAGAQGIAAYSKSIGQPIPDSVIKAWGTGRITPSESNEIIRRIAEGYTPDQIQKQFPNASAQDMMDLAQTWAKVKDNPRALKALNLESEEEMKSKLLDLKIKEGHAMEAGHPEIKDAHVFTEASIIAQKKYGAPYLELDKAKQGAALAEASAAVEARDVRKMQLANQLSLDKAIQLASIRADAVAQKPLTIPQKEKLLEGPKKARDTLAAIDKLESSLDSVPEDALPKGESYASQKWAQIKRDTFYKGNTPLTNFKQLWAPISVGQIDRQLFDEKNVKFRAAFDQQVGMLDNMPPKAAIKDYLKNVRELINKRSDENLSDWEDLNYPKDVLDVTRKILGKTGHPLAPKETEGPADLVYNRKTKTWGKP